MSFKSLNYSFLMLASLAGTAAAVPAVSFLAGSACAASVNVGSFAGPVKDSTGAKIGKITKKGQIIDGESGVPIATITPMGQVTSLTGTVLGTANQGDRLKAYQLAKSPVAAQVAPDVQSKPAPVLPAAQNAGAYAGIVKTSANQPIGKIMPNGNIMDFHIHKVIGHVNAAGQVTGTSGIVLGNVGPADKFAAYNLARKSVAL